MRSQDHMRIETGARPVRNGTTVPEDASSEVVWARVDEGFYVCSVPGRFLGCIDRQADGRFVAMDIYTQPIGTFAGLAQAMTAVEAARHRKAHS